MNSRILLLLGVAVSGFAGEIVNRNAGMSSERSGVEYRGTFWKSITLRLTLSVRIRQRCSCSGLPRAEIPDNA